MATKILKKSDAFYDSFFRNPNPDKETTHYCPGCGHGNVHKFIAETLEDFGVTDDSIVVSPVGCSVFAYYYFNTGNIQAAHGRAPAVATGIKRAHPKSIVISYQGDGDLAAIGTAEIIHAANRGENITVFFINNAIYGMTGGQMAPTTMVGQKTTTTPRGRNPENEGYPIKVVELLNQLDAPVYLERVSLHNVKERNKARKAVKKALQNQIDNKGFSLVEVLSPCPSGWKMDPVDSLKWIETEMTKIFPLGVLRDKTAEFEKSEVTITTADAEMVKEQLGLNKLIDKKYDQAETPEKYLNPGIKVAGFGGQGVLLLGVAIAQTALMEGYHVSWIPSYGPEMRGGTANCHVRFSKNEIGSPTVDNPSVLFAFNRPSLEKFESDVAKDGIIIYDSSLCDIEPSRKDVEVLAIPARQIADDLGNGRVSNMIMLGAYVGYTNSLSKETLIDVLQVVVSRKKLIEVNEKAILAGFEFGQNARK